ncbi:hypothetical protein Acsp07_36850 [Actinomycetospora sp. NBRC 106378]|nr:hypothetical protein Acsp07_36850 [Actinomycetospora sp. NBRC 106378]
MTDQLSGSGQAARHPHTRPYALVSGVINAASVWAGPTGSPCVTVVGSGAMTQTPIYDEVRRSLGRADRVERRSFRGEDGAAGPERVSRPVMLRGSGGRHRRSGD